MKTNDMGTIEEGRGVLQGSLGLSVLYIPNRTAFDALI